MLYWTIGNVHPEFRSTQNCIQLYAIVKTDYLKKPNALRKIVTPFLTDIQTLRTNGLNMKVHGEIENYKGSMLFGAGATPVLALLGGDRPCRICTTTADEWKLEFHESNFTLRNPIDHLNHVDVVPDPTLSKAATNYWKLDYGVNTRSPLMDIIDVTKCLPQDLMHIFIEGPLTILCKPVLKLSHQRIGFIYCE